ncbi:MAG: hypothetical protein OHK0045_23460 [Raineya sp.]
MKKIFCIALFTFSIQFLCAQQIPKAEWVRGNWKVAKLEIPHYEQILARATPEKRKQVEEELKILAQSGDFRFNANGTYFITFAGNKEEGKWQVNQYVSKIIKQEKLPDGSFQKPDEVGIELLTKNTMVLLNDYEGGEIIRITLKK